MGIRVGSSIRLKRGSKTTAVLSIPPVVDSGLPRFDGQQLLKIFPGPPEYFKRSTVWPSDEVELNRISLVSSVKGDTWADTVENLLHNNRSAFKMIKERHGDSRGPSPLSGFDSGLNHYISKKPLFRISDGRGGTTGIYLEITEDDIKHPNSDWQKTALKIRRSNRFMLFLSLGRNSAAISKHLMGKITVDGGGEDNFPGVLSSIHFIGGDSGNVEVGFQHWAELEYPSRYLAQTIVGNRGNIKLF